MQREPSPTPHLLPPLSTCLCVWRLGRGVQRRRSATPRPSGEAGAAVTAAWLRLEVAGRQARAEDWGRRTGRTLTLNHTLSKKSSSDGGLALAQGDGRELLGKLHLFSKLVEVSSGVGARRQHEDEGCGGVGVFEYHRQVGCLQGRRDARAT